ncbi:hypothetical protein RB25_25195 [Herbaspirillum rubrisubalbicans]|nr:hypothetical protein RB25_25195 [Herbaspirillum rubrisubalbicans]
MAGGVPPSDPYYSLLKGLQDKGATYQEEMVALLKTGEFVYERYLDAARDALTRNGEITQRTGGAASMLAGATGMVVGGAFRYRGGSVCADCRGELCACADWSVCCSRVE